MGHQNKGGFLDVLFKRYQSPMGMGHSKKHTQRATRWSCINLLWVWDTLWTCMWLREDPVSISYGYGTRNTELHNILKKERVSISYGYGTLDVSNLVPINLSYQSPMGMGHLMLKFSQFWLTTTSINLLWVWDTTRFRCKMDYNT